MLTTSLVSTLLISGLYQATTSNGPELCPQRVRVKQWGAENYALSVYYSGECADQGPYLYECAWGGPIDGTSGWTCLNGLIEFQIVTPTRYLWRNRSYQFEGVFDLRSD
jgi:hypothetical protein